MSEANDRKDIDVIELENTATLPLQADKDDLQVEEGGPRSAFAAWERGPMVRKFWRLYITGVLVASGGM